MEEGGKERKDREEREGKGKRKRGEGKSGKTDLCWIRVCDSQESEDSTTFPSFGKFENQKFWVPQIFVEPPLCACLDLILCVGVLEQFYALLTDLLRTSLAARFRPFIFYS